MRPVMRLNPHVDVVFLLNQNHNFQRSKQTNKIQMFSVYTDAAKKPIIVLNGEVDVNHSQNRQHIFLRVTDTSSMK